MTEQRSGRWLKAVRPIAVAAVFLALAYVAYRGIWRAASDSHDLTVGYAAARGWILGFDPYDVAVLKRELLRAGGGELATGGLLDGLRNVYFAPTLPLFLLVAIPSWPDARLLVLALNVAAAAFMALGIVHLAGMRWSSSRGLGLMAFVLALGPLHLTMSLGQTGIVATAAIIAAILVERSGHRSSAGILYGLATAAKVQLGIPFVAYLLWRRRWATAMTAVVVLGGLTLLSVVRMEVAAVPWFDSWQQNLASLLGPGGVNDAGPLNPERYSLINLQYPLHSLIASGVVVNLIVYAAVGAAALSTVWLIHDGYRDQELLAVSIVAVLGLLVTYHRYYDAVLLALPIAWAFSALGTTRWRYGVAVLAFNVAFIVPIVGALRTAQRQQILPSSLTDSLLWDVVVLPIPTWTLVALVVVLLWAAARQRWPSTGFPTASSPPHSAPGPEPG